mgnify:CR=1 FL=1
MNLPAAFEEKMRALLGDEFDEYIACYEEPRYYGMRVNTGKISVEEFEKICPFEIRKIPWIENGFYYDGDKVSPAKHPYYFAGLYYLQEPSAMTPANRLPVEPGDRVLDVCAAPGGKATELGAKLQGTGVLAANDLSSSRAKGLLKNLELFGIGNVLVLSEEPGKLVSYFEGYFDKILIDAPCSGEGMFRKDKKMVKAWEEHGPSFFSKIQKSIITQAAQMLRPGGMLLYSTCTFSPEENEQIIAWVLREFPEMQLIPMKGYEGFSEGRPDLADGNPELKKCVRIWPHHMDGEGHFVALMQKSRTPEMDDVSPEKSSAYISEADEEPSEHDDVKKKKKKAKKGRKDQKERNEAAGCTRQERAVLESFFADVKAEVDWKRIEVRKGFAYYLPEGVEGKKNLVFVRNGLYLGEIRKDRFEPSQAFAMVLQKKEFASSIDFSAKDERVIRYLKGETVDVSDLECGKEKGWQLVCVDGYPLGWGKLVNGTLKNKYLSGWRMKVNG